MQSKSVLFRPLYEQVCHCDLAVRYIGIPVPLQPVGGDESDEQALLGAGLPAECFAAIVQFEEFVF